MSWQTLAKNLVLLLSILILLSVFLIAVRHLALEAYLRDVRFIMLEIQTLETQVHNLSMRIRDLDYQLSARISELEELIQSQG